MKVPSRPALDIALPALRHGARADVGVDRHVDGLDFAGADLHDLQADGARLLECRLLECQLGQARLRRARLSSCVLDGVTAMAIDAAESTWADVVVKGGRVGALLLNGAELRRVALVGVRVDYLNLRAASVTEVRLVDCRIGELDLSAADLSHVWFERCQVARLDITGARLTALDLTGADLDALDGIGSIRGAVLNAAQVTSLAPAFAAHLGVDVRDES